MISPHLQATEVELIAKAVSASGHDDIMQQYQQRHKPTFIQPVNVLHAERGPHTRECNNIGGYVMSCG